MNNLPEHIKEDLKEIEKSIPKYPIKLICTGIALIGFWYLSVQTGFHFLIFTIIGIVLTFFFLLGVFSWCFVKYILKNIR